MITTTKSSQFQRKQWYAFSKFPFTINFGQLLKNPNFKRQRREEPSITKGTMWYLDCWFHLRLTFWDLWFRAILLLLLLLHNPPANSPQLSWGRSCATGGSIPFPPLEYYVSHEICKTGLRSKKMSALRRITNLFCVWVFTWVVFGFVLFWDSTSWSLCVTISDPGTCQKHTFMYSFLVSCRPGMNSRLS